MRLVYAANRLTGPHESSAEFCAAHPELLDKLLLRRFYSRERIMTLQAKAEFVEPDLTPLPDDDSATDVLPTGLCITRRFPSSLKSRSRDER
jgi:hypothetical protein